MRMVEDRIQYLAVDIIKQAIFDLKSDKEKDRKGKRILIHKKLLVLEYMQVK